MSDLVVLVFITLLTLAGVVGLFVWDFAWSAALIACAGAWLMAWIYLKSRQ